MNPATQAAAAAQPIRTLLAPIAHHLDEVDRDLREQMRSDDPFVDRLLRYGGQLGGKRLRPALLLLSAAGAGEIRPAHYRLAVVIEMIHTATLVHDDILDDATTRRHLATVNARWNNETSVLLGDYLFSHAFYLATTADQQSPYACARIGQSTNLVCRGELQQVGNRGNFQLTESEYYQIIDGKTAELCACACHLGAHYAGADANLTAAMEMYGRNLGMAFQIADDLLDLVGQEQTTGKSLGTDLEKQKLTLPIIRALGEADESQRVQLLRIIAEDSPERCNRFELLKLLESTGAILYAQAQGRRFARQAREQLAALPDSPLRQVLCELPEFVVGRSA